MQRKSNWRDVRRWLPGVLISIVAIGVVFRLSNWEDLSMAFRNIRPVNFLIAILLTVLSLGTRGMAWRVLLENKPTFKQSFFVINEGYLLNNIFPLRAGEIGRAVFMGRISGYGPLHVLSTIVIERAFDLAVAAGMLLSTLPLALGMNWAKPVAMVTLGLVVTGLLTLFLIARYNQQVQAWVTRLGKSSPFIERQVIPRIDSVLRGLSVLTKPSQFLLSLFWIILSWVLWVLTHYVMLITIAPGAPIWWAMFVDSVLALGVAVPSAPAALGVFEASIVGALSLLGVGPSVALAYAILMHFLNFASTGIFGFIGLFQEGRSITSAFAEIQLRDR